MAVEEKILIREVNHSDTDKLAQLYEKVWPDVTFDKHSKARFVIEESEGVSFCAEDNGRIVGSRTSFKMNMFYGNEPIKCVQFADSCIDLSYRGKGLFLKLNQAFLKKFFSDGSLVYNISVYASKKAYEKLGWHYIESLMMLRKPIRFFHILWKLKGDIRKLAGDICWELDSPVFSIPEDLIKKREDQLAYKPLLHIRYNSDIILWRHKSGSGINCIFDKNIGAIIYKRGYKEGLTIIEIGELFLKNYDKSTFKKAIKLIKSQLKPDIISVMISLGHPLLSYYRSEGFLHNPKQKFLYHGTRVEDDEMRKIAENPNSWAISSLDIDTF